MEKLRIEWHRCSDEHGEGFMELIPDKFFPCTFNTATKLFKLVARWCSDEIIAELKEYLLTEQAEVKRMLDKPLLDSDIKNLQMLYKRYGSNIKTLEKYTERK